MVRAREASASGAALLSDACAAGAALGVAIVAALSGLLYPVNIPPRYLVAYR